MTLTRQRISRRLLWGLAVAGCLVCMGGFVWALWFMALDDAYPSAKNLSYLKRYWLGFAVTWVQLSMIATLLLTSRSSDHWRRWRWQVALILVVAVAARLVVVFTHMPQLSDDLWRYIHDGGMVASGHNPYERSPQDVGFADAPAPLILDRVNHPELVTIYPPTAQYSFAGLWLLRGESWDPFGDMTFRFGMVAFDVLVIVLLLCALRRRGRSPWWAALYAWHPLTLSEFAGEGHVDILGIVLLVAALLLLERLQKSARKAVLGGVAFGASLLIKPAALPLALPIAWRQRGQWRRVLLVAAACVLTCVVLFVPFVFAPGGVDGWLATLRRFADAWQHNASAFDVLNHLLGDRAPVKMILAAVLLVVVLAATRRSRDVWSAGMVILFAMFLLSTTAHPWYLLWALALLPMRFSASLWLLSWTVSFSYFVLADRAAWQLPAWVQWAEYGPVYAVLVFELLIAVFRRSPDRDVVRCVG